MAKKPKTVLGHVGAVIGSYWLAVALLVNLFLLTWLGTLAQVDKGIYWVQKEYFESLYVVTRMPVTPTVTLPLVLPGGLPTLGLLSISLVIGGLIRIRKTRRTIGVIIAHVGIVLLMVGSVVEYKQKVYGSVLLHEGEQSQQYSDYQLHELALWNTASATGVEEHLIPEGDFDDLAGTKSRTFESDALPFDVVVSHYMRNSEPARAVGVGIPTAPVIDGLFLAEKPRNTEPEQDLTGVYVKVLTDGGASMEETFLHGREIRPFTFEAAGKTWAIMLRRQMRTLPFGIRLETFTKDDHPGMTMARSYSSDVLRIDPDGTEVPVHIRMNEPLRHQGYIVYQSGFGPQNGMPGAPYSILAVSQNPSDRIPWWSVSIIAFGLVWTMIDRLGLFLAKQRRRSAGAARSTDSEADSPKAAA